MRFKIIFLTIILLVPVFLISGSITHTFHFSKQDINFSTYNGYDVLTMRNGVANTEVSSPSIPFIVSNFVIPSSAEVTKVQVISKKTEELLGAYDICPVQTPRPISSKEDIPFVEPDPSIYYSSNPYPEKDIVSFPSGSMSGFRIAGIFVNPLKYIPNEKKLILSTEITVNIQYREGAHRIIILTEKQRDVFKECVNIVILNKDDIKRFSPPVKPDSKNDVNYAIITAANLTSNFQKLANWKISAGYSAQVFSTNWIDVNYYGWDQPERIRKFLKDYFTNHGLIFAVLGGDADIILERDAYSLLFPYDVASDYYYSDLDGNWDADGDHIYGELFVDSVDGYCDIYVGRPPIGGQTHIASFLKKDSVYIYDPPNYTQKILLPSVKLTNNWHGREVNNKIGNMFSHQDWTVTKLEDTNALKPNTKNHFNQNYNFMHIASHGNEYGFYTMSGDEIFISTEIQDLTNTMPTILNSIACYVGNFDWPIDCIGDLLMNKSDGAGCVAAVLNSRKGYCNPPQMGPSETMDTCFYHVIVNDTFNIGMVHAATKNYFRNTIWDNLYWHYCGLGLNLFGDPEMRVRSEFPPMTPTGFEAHAESFPVSPEIVLSWDDILHEDAYRIYRSNNPLPDTNWCLLVQLPANYTSHHDANPNNDWGKIYTYYIVSWNEKYGESNRSPIVHETTWVQIPEITSVYPYPYPYGPYMEIKWDWEYGVYGADSIVYLQSGPSSEPSYNFYHDTVQTNFQQHLMIDRDNFPPKGKTVGYMPKFYTKRGGQQWNPLYIWGLYKFYTRPGPDPPIVSTADTFATGYSNSRKIVVDSNDRMHITFTSNDTVYYVYSDDCERFSTPVDVGNGRYPGIALDGNEYPHICWVKENSEYEGYILYHSKLTQSGWTSPDELLEETDREFTPPSFDIGKVNNVAYLTWADFPLSGDKWIIYKGSFSLLDSTPYIEPVAYDSAVEMSPESPNYICDQTGLVDVDGYLLWEKDGDIYAGVEVNGVVQYITNLSNSLNLSIHPNLSIWGDNIYAVWQEEFPFENNKILFTKRPTAISSNWEDPVELTDFPDAVEFPVCHGPFVLASGKRYAQGNYDIYALKKEEFGDVSHICQITGTETKSKFPAVCYTQRFPQQKLYVIWTEDTTSTKGQPVGMVKAKMIVEMLPIPTIAVNLGTPDGSPYTVQREGFKIFGYPACQQVDYHPQELIYRFVGLKPSEAYKMKLIFYYKNADFYQWLLRVKVDGHPIGGIILEQDKPTYFEKWIPATAYQSGVLDISIEKWSGDYAVCSEIFLYEYKKTNGGEGTQLAENLVNLTRKMQFIAPKPNPFRGSTKIGFVISQKEKVTLKIYDVSGRLCKTLVNKKLNAGTYYYNWDGKGEDVKRSVCGIYFCVLNIGEKRFVRKIVKIK